MAKAKKKASVKKKIVKKAATKKVTQKKSNKNKPGLYANIHKAQLREKRGGRKVRSKGQNGAPSEEAFKKARKTAKK